MGSEKRQARNFEPTPDTICIISANHEMIVSPALGGEMMTMRESIDRKILDLQRILTTTDDQFTIALVNLAIESFVSERDSLPALPLTKDRDQR